jgi:peptidoglycan/LPS O-acetylase OafA/YrhL
MPRRPELYAQTALRGIAALIVFIAHARFYILFPEFPVLANIYTVFLWHNVAVDLFFELSGFILCYVYLSGAIRWKEYALARFSRIYPLYLAGTLAFLGMSFIGYLKTGILNENASAPLVISNLLLVQSWPLIPNFPSINLPAWTISVEVFLYLFLFPPLFYFQKYLSHRVKGVLAVAPVAVLVAIYCFSPGVHYAGDPEIGLLRGILCFTSGFFVCALGLDRDFSFNTPKKVEAVFLLVTASCLLFEFPFGRGVAVMSFPFLAYLSAQRHSVLTRVMAVPVLQWLGDISYSVYIWHWPILKAIGPLTGLRKIGEMNFPVLSTPFHLRIFCVVTALISVLAVSHLSHYYFERPLSNWLRKKVA